MLFFKNDYTEGAHEKILQAMVETNGEQHIGYGLDTHSENAKNLIKEAIGRPDADVHLIVGGTQTNLIAISSFLRPIEAVIATNLGHISVHETGAIEATGHKVIEMYSEDGILTTQMIEKAVLAHTDEHMVKPKMVYISDSTELGTIYTKQMLKEISEICKKHDLYLFIDGARIGVALTCEQNDLTLNDIANLCDAFYIGGTKSGAMFGEALIILNDDLKKYMRYNIKQKGAMLAKGRFLGIQFETLMKENLLFEISKHANEMAKLLTEIFEKNEIKFVSYPVTNQIFVHIPKEVHEKLQEKCHYEIQGMDNDYVQARFVTSFATPKEDVEAFAKLLAEIKI